MHNYFDVFEYLDFLRARWKFPALACAFAIAAALVIGFLLPKRYTATATILIDPPAAGDPRIATAVSTVYLESLKSYEFLAANDQLFVRAAERFHLRDRDGSPIESLKRRVLKVEKLRDTRALQIRVTLPDPKAAQAVVQFIAEGTVELSRSGGRAADEAMIEEAAQAAEDAKARLNEADTAWQKSAGTQSSEALRVEVSEDGYLKSRIEEELLDEQANVGARAELLDRRVSELTRVINQTSAALAQQTAREEDLRAALTAARTSYEAAAQRLADLRLSKGSRSEWLRVIDAGIIPQRPSSPNAPLILIGAAVLALFGSLLYLSISFSLTRGRRPYDLPMHIASHGHD
jgi:tyrosine-protein kinase Etk/Wzc